MFGVDTTELLIVALAALVFIGPKELPGAMRTLGRWIGQARGHARHFTAGIENMMREAELEEMEKRWREENERIMREHPASLSFAAPSDGGVSPATSPEVNAEADGAAPSLFVTSEGEASSPSVAPAEEEPTLPLPEPEHHRRELP